MCKYTKGSLLRTGNTPYTSLFLYIEKGYPLILFFFTFFFAFFLKFFVFKAMNASLIFIFLQHFNEKRLIKHV